MTDWQARAEAAESALREARKWPIELAKVTGLGNDATPEETANQISDNTNLRASRSAISAASSLSRHSIASTPFQSWPAGKVVFASEYDRMKQRAEVAEAELRELKGNQIGPGSRDTKIPLTCFFCGKHVPVAFNQCQSCKEAAETALRGQTELATGLQVKFGQERDYGAHWNAKAIHLKDELEQVRELLRRKDEALQFAVDNLDLAYWGAPFDEDHPQGLYTCGFCEETWKPNGEGKQQHEPECVISRLEAALSPSPKGKEGEIVNEIFAPEIAIREAANLCMSEANRWDGNDAKTCLHWRAVVVGLNAALLILAVKTTDQAAGRIVLSEQMFIDQWWKRRFPTANPPTWDAAITCVDALDLLVQYRTYLAEGSE